MSKCPYCKTDIEADSFVCKNCKQIVKLVNELTEKLNASTSQPLTTTTLPEMNRHDFYFHLCFYLVFLTIPISILGYSKNVEVFIFLFYLIAGITTFLFTLVTANYTQFKNVIVLSLIGFIMPQLFLFLNVFFRVIPSEIGIVSAAKVIKTLAFSSYVMLAIGVLTGLLVKLMNRRHDLSQLYNYKEPVEWVIKGEDLKEKVVKVSAALGTIVALISSVKFLFQ